MARLKHRRSDRESATLARPEQSTGRLLWPLAFLPTAFLIVALFITTNRHNAQLQAQAAAFNAQLAEAAATHNEQLTRMAAECNARLAAEADKRK